MVLAPLNMSASSLSHQVGVMWGVLWCPSASGEMWNILFYLLTRYNLSIIHFLLDLLSVPDVLSTVGWEELEASGEHEEQRL